MWTSAGIRAPVVHMQNAKTMRALSSAHVWKVTLEMELHVKVSRWYCLNKLIRARAAFS